MTRSVQVSAGVAVIVLAAVVAVAQLGAQGRGMRGRGGFGPFGGPGMLPMHALDLTETQQQQIKAITEKHKAELDPLGERLANARRALDTAVTATPIDDQAIRAKAAELGAVEADAAVLRARIHAEIWQVLTPEQQQKAETLRAGRGEGRRGRASGPMGGFGRGGCL